MLKTLNINIFCDEEIVMQCLKNIKQIYIKKQNKENNTMASTS